MGKPRLPNKRKEYKELNKRLAGYMMQVRKIYERLNEKVASVVESVGYDGAVEFSFSDYPEVKRDLQLLQRQFVGDMQSLIYSGTSAEWKISNLLQDLVADKALRFYRAQVYGERFKHYYQTNSAQLKAFQARRNRGLNLSAKLWNQSQIYKDSLEATISTAIEKGMSAITLSKRISKYLSDWSSLQADYQEKYAKATRCYDCEYRSMRLARNEINIAYRTAEQLRWQQFDFILGYKIKLSHSHPRYDICDDMAGDYPKDFKFVGWHPNCYLPNALVLTDSGWKFIKDVSNCDKILSLNPDTRNIEYVGIVAKQASPYQGEIVRFRNRSLDCAVTADHRMAYLNKSDGQIKYKTALEFNKNMGAFYRGCKYYAEDITDIDINGDIVPFDLFCEFMGYWLSVGSIMHNHQVAISQRKGEPAYDGILRCISNLGHKSYICKDVIVFNDCKLNSYLKQFGTCKNKFIPKEIICSSRRQISIFLDAFVKCDGHIRKPKSFIGSHGNVFNSVNLERMFFTTSERLYGGLCEMLLKIGKRPSVSIRHPSVTVKRNGSIIKGNYDMYIIRECNSLTSAVFTKTQEQYNGTVYDLTLERNHIMYIQQNGECYWGSNCLCYTVPIVMSEDEYWSGNSQNMVTAPPANFGKWIDKVDNLERIGKAYERGTLPYWLRDNEKIKYCSVLMSKARSVGNAIQEQAELIAKKYGGVVTPINYKGFSSLYRKLNSEKGMLVSDIKDSVRNIIIVENGNIEKVVKALQSLPEISRYKKQTPDKFYGYSGNIINLKMPNGIQAEIQVNTPKMIFAKETETNARRILGDNIWEQIAQETGMQGGLGHKYYEEIRVLDKISDKSKVEELTKISKSYYAHFR